MAAIQKALGKPINAIVPDEYADTRLPALRMKNVNVAQLFEALGAATTRTVATVANTYYGGGAYSNYKSYTSTVIGCGFKSAAPNPTDETIWYFYVNRPALPTVSPDEPRKVCRFYALAPYLERHLTVDDITTAVKTGWKMLGEPDAASISFHKDTKLLIAVGEPTALETIDAVLKALGEPKPAAQVPGQGRPMRIPTPVEPGSAPAMPPASPEQN